VLGGAAGRRGIEPDAFFVTHFLTTLAPGELLVETVWPQPEEFEGAAFEEFALRAGDYALSMVAVVVRRIDDVAADVRIRIGAVTDRPTGFADVEAAVEGTFVTPAVAREAGALAAAAGDPAGAEPADGGERALPACVQRQIGLAFHVLIHGVTDDRRHGD